MQTILLRLKRLFSTNLLNILGLSIAFTAFIILLIQVNYDFSYDKSYKNADRIFRMETLNQHSGTFGRIMSRPKGELIINSFPEIEQGGCVDISTRTMYYFAKPDDVTEPIAYKSVTASHTIPLVFDFELIDGNFEDFAKPNHILLPESMAKLFFNGKSCVGKELISSLSKSDVENRNANCYTIAGVYKDFPKNVTEGNMAYINIHDNNIDNRSVSSYIYYLKLHKSSNPKTLAEKIEKFIVKNYYENKESASADSLRLHKLHDVYFARDLDANEITGNYSITISLLTIAILIILIAIINFVNFSMATIPLNIRKINTKKVLGSTNAALRFQQIADVTLLSLFSFGIALAIVDVIAGSSFSTLVSGELELSKNAGILVLSGLIAVFVGILGSLYPVFYSTSFPPAVILKGSFGLSVRGKRLRSSLIAFQYVISSTLLIVSIFIFVQSNFMKKYDLGFVRENILTVSTSQTVANQRDAFLNRLKTNPNILDVTYSDGQIVSIGKMGWGREYHDKSVNFACLPVSTNFLDFFGLEVFEGRGFREDDKLKRNGTIIFNELAVEQYEFELDDKIYGHMYSEPADIVGVVKNFNFQPLQYKIQPIALYVYGSHPWREQTYAFIKVTGTDFKNSIDHIRKTLAEFDPNLSNADINFMDNGIEMLYKKEDNLAKLILIFCVLSVFISIIGVLGLIFFETQFRRKEIGIRRVFGSSVSEILSMFNKEYLKITAICYFISIPIAFFIIKEWLKNFAYRSPIPFWVWIVAFVVIFALTAIVISLQSLKTARSNPVNSIKSDS